jgi:tellurite resistance protein TehA-like permease
MTANPLLPTAYDIIWSVSVLVAVAMLAWTLVSIARSGMDSSAKLAWVLIVFLLPVIGPICWLVVRPQKRDGSLS